MSYRETIRKNKQLLIIVIAAGAIASYLLPLDNLLALTQPGTGHSNSANVNSNARASILASINGAGRTGNTNPAANSQSGGQGNPTNNGATGSGSNIGAGTANTDGTNPNAQFAANQKSTTVPGSDTTFSNGNSAQIGGPGDNGNIGRGNTGNGNIGHGNNGNGNTGNFNNGNSNIGNFNNGNGHVGNFCQNGKGGAYGCVAHNPHFTG